VTYIRNVIPRLAAIPGLRLTVALPPGIGKELSAFPNVELLEMQMPALRRFWYEQSSLPAVIRRSRADVLLSTGNFALRNSPVPQILLSRNSIYTSTDFYRDLLARHEYATWMDTRLRGVLAKRSITWADVTVAPSEAFAAELRRWTGVEVRAIHHGFDRDAFTSDPGQLPSEIQEKLRCAAGTLKLLFVSHYNYYRNFETLLRALPILRKKLSGRRIKLFLTCKLVAGENPGTYNPAAAARLVKELAVSDLVVELGSVPYHRLHRLYSSADIYVTPAYTETFAHPLVEAMASGLPVVASDLAVHREICVDTAEYFPKFSSEALAEKVAGVARSSDGPKKIAAAGLERSRQFSWERHAEEIMRLSDDLIEPKTSQALARQPRRL